MTPEEIQAAHDRVSEQMLQEHDRQWTILLKFKSGDCPYRIYPGRSACCNSPGAGRFSVKNRGELECKEGICPARIQDVMDL
jgi:hypothetical protein